MKLTYVPFNNNRLNFQNTWAEKVRNARDAGDLRPIETTYRQKAVSSDFGAFGWLTGPSPFWKVARSARHQRPLAGRRDVGAPRQQLRARLPRRRRCATCRPRFETTDQHCGAARSRRRRSSARPTASTSSAATSCRRSSAATTRSSSAIAGATRTRRASTIAAASSKRASPTASPNSSRHLARPATPSRTSTPTRSTSRTRSRKNRLTLNIGVRYDMPGRRGAGRPTVPANPFFPTLMPAIDFQGADAGVVWKDFSPRIGFTYDLKGDGRNVVSSSYATYYGQMSPGQLSSQLAATGAVFVRYPWTDANGDGFVQPTKSTPTGAVPQQEHGVRSGEPGQHRRRRRASIRTSRTIARANSSSASTVSSARTMAVGGSYIWRKYDQFLWNDRDNYTSANYRAVTFTPTGCPAGARCEPVTYFEPTIQLPSAERLHEPSRIGSATSTASS